MPKNIIVLSLTIMPQVNLFILWYSGLPYWRTEPNPALLASMEALDQNEPSAQLESVLTLIRLTHDHEYNLRPKTDVTRIYHRLAYGESIRHTLTTSPPGFL